MDPFGKFLAAAGAALFGAHPADEPPRQHQPRTHREARMATPPPLPRIKPAQEQVATADAAPVAESRPAAAAPPVEATPAAIAAVSSYKADRLRPAHPGDPDLANGEFVPLATVRPSDRLGAGQTEAASQGLDSLLFADNADEALHFRFADSFPEVRANRAFQPGGPLADDVILPVPKPPTPAADAAPAPDAAAAEEAAVAEEAARPAEAPRPRIKPQGPFIRANAGGVQVARLEPADRAPPRRNGGSRSDLSCMTALASLHVEAVALPSIQDGACGIEAPLEVKRIGEGSSEVSLEPAATINCGVAGALADWLNSDVQPAAKQILGGRITGLRIAASYSCRGRNNVRGARLSEHSFGNALDIAAFEVDGKDWIVVEPQPSERDGRFLTAIRQEACGPFTTVLGPGVAYHSDHFHLDLAARGRSGRSLYCH